MGKDSRRVSLRLIEALGIRSGQALTTRVLRRENRHEFCEAGTDVVPFKLTDEAHGPGVRAIKIEGELDLAFADQLSEALDRAAECRVVLIDLSECEFIDSTGTSVIVRAYVAMKQEGRRLALVAPAAQIRRYLEMIGLMQDNLVFENAEKAMAAVDQDGDPE